MKHRLISLATAGALIAFAGPVFAHGDSHAAKHGGIVVETKTLDFEVVAKPEAVVVYVSDHGKDVALAGAKGKVTLLNGTEKSEADLVVAGDRLEARGPFKVAKGTKGIASVTLAGKAAATARFEVK
ncbi:hypothetical protein ACO2Q9_18800 [Variovorax sp. VNK109]|jgi:hypothetical protein|uniref:hypothetical protein n=1 Tax=Variovorax sp. VNK109 TaxID=3400919 RepID=UPI003C08394E